MPSKVEDTIPQDHASPRAEPIRGTGLLKCKAFPILFMIQDHRTALAITLVPLLLCSFAHNTVNAHLCFLQEQSR